MLCAAHLPRLNQYAISSSDLQLTFYDDASHRQIKNAPTPSSQMCLSWAPPDGGHGGTLFSAGASDPSIVDKLWSILPWLYVWHAYYSAPSPRLLLQASPTTNCPSRRRHARRSPPRR